MKRFFRNFDFVFLLLAFFVFISCATGSSLSEENRKQMELNKEQGLPLWVNCSFNSHDAAVYIPGYKAGSNGFFASGCGNSQAEAKLDAVKNLVSYCTNTFGYTTGTSSKTLIGSRIIDSFSGQDGTVYVLMFISEKEAKKTLGG